MSQHHTEEGQLVDEAVGEIIDVEEYAKAGKPVPKGKQYRLRVDKDRFVVKQAYIAGHEILALVQKTPQSHQLYQHIRGGQTTVVQPADRVDLSAPGVERFTTLKIENTEGR